MRYFSTAVLIRDPKNRETFLVNCTKKFQISQLVLHRTLPVPYYHSWPSPPLLIWFVYARLIRALNGPTRTVYEHKCLAGFCVEVRFLDMRTGVPKMRNEKKGKRKRRKELLTEIHHLRMQRIYNSGGAVFSWLVERRLCWVTYLQYNWYRK